MGSGESFADRLPAVHVAARPGAYNLLSVALIETLPASWYADAEIWQAERTAIWAKEWIHIGYRHQIDRPGGFVTESLAGFQLFAHRGADGVLRAFHNVCPHRAGPIVPAGEGCQLQLVCRYHGWAFHPDGRLRNARDFGAEVPTEIGLKPIRVHDWRGMIFICLSDETPDFPEWFGDFAQECDEYVFDDYRFHSRTVRPMRVGVTGTELAATVRDRSNAIFVPRHF